MWVSGEPGSGKMTFYLLHPTALQNLVICLDSLVFWGYNWMMLCDLGCFYFYFFFLWSCWFSLQTSNLFSSSQLLFIFLFSRRWYAGPVEVASPPWQDQRQPLQTKRDRWLRDRQSKAPKSHLRSRFAHNSISVQFCLTISLFFILFKFLQDTLDTLFGILDESSQRYGLKVFDSLVSTLYFDVLSVLLAEFFMTNL